MQMSVRCGQGSVSRQRPWCWHVATFPPLFFRLLASGWECWRTPLAPWRSWETSGPSTTVSKWSSSWAVAPRSPTARLKGTGRRREGSERHAGTLYIIISYMIKAHNQPSPSSHEDCGSKQTYWVYQIDFRLRSLHGLSLTRPEPRFRRHLWRWGCLSPLRRVQRLIWPLRGAITVHCEALHAFEDNRAIWDESHAFTVHPQHQHGTHSLINTDAPSTCRSACVLEWQTAPLGRIWRLEVSHCTGPLRLISLTKLMLWLFFFFFLLIFAVYIVWNVFIFILNFD